MKRMMVAAAFNPTPVTTIKQAELNSRASERQVARLIGWVMGGSFVLIMALYSMVL
jgi:hypothetical protein